jgi:hypothetical protein
MLKMAKHAHDYAKLNNQPQAKFVTTESLFYFKENNAHIFYGGEFKK